MKNIIKNLLGGLSFGLGILIVVYAATISNLGGNTINKGDTIEESWFQKVDDKLGELANNISGDNLINLNNPVNNTDAATKAYVDASAGASPGSIDWRDCEYKTLTNSYNTSSNMYLECSTGYELVHWNCTIGQDSAEYYGCWLEGINKLKTRENRGSGWGGNIKASIKCCKVNQ